MIETGPATVGRRFALEECLGRGGFGEVWRATMTSPSGIQTVVAVKLLHPDLEGAEDALTRLRDEGRLLGLLDHPSIVKVIDLCQLRGQVALVTEFVNGADLKRCIRGSARMPPNVALEAVARVAEALDLAFHAVAPDGTPLALVHRDVKPANIRIGRRGEVKLLDFGIARASLRFTRTATNMLVGSFGYLAPERMQLRASPGGEMDVFALGCVLFEGLTGKGLFTEVEQAGQVSLALSPDLFRDFVARELAGVDERYRPLLASMLSYEPAARPNAREVMRQCDAIAERLGGPSLRRWCQERDWSADVSTYQGALKGVVLAEDHAPTRWEPLRPPDTRSPAQPVPVDEAPTVAAPVDEAATMSQSVPVTTSTRRPLVAAVFALGSVGLGSVVGALVLVLGLALGWRWFTSTAVTPPVEVAPDPVAAAAPADEALPVAVEPADPTPSTPAPAPARLGVGAAPPPGPVVPRPARAPVAEPATVVVEGSVPVTLSANGRSAVAGAVPAGQWQLLADFGKGPVVAGTVDLVAGQTVTIRCSRAMYDCQVSR